MPEAEQTLDGEYELLENHTFGPVNYKRYMSWKKGSGKITLGIRILKANSDEVNWSIDPGWSVKVEDVNFKLVRTIT
ncbi:uncharacterized protein EAF02_007331 [Botrytis sinoallii]|uniref:uncharacterized protein n=1 Tax=Botrytis sinoallii TaxID=1463999 RepID=UPI001902775D|nr:uncharacterized protein EAF02_007331 [Botrytis sinoallii]KAF7880485.1 hypothetical protein EAF02_007331 [Botrytis sinoallii]